MTLFLDLDGVFADFNKQKDLLLPEWRGREYHHLSKKVWTEEEHTRNKEVEECMRTPGFWEGIPLCQDAYNLWDFCLPYHPVILTAVPSVPEWKERITYEKNKWIDHYLGFKVPRIICYRSEKQNYVTGLHDILLDDNIQNISEWTEAGGFGIYHTDVDNSIRKLNHVLKDMN